MQHEDDAPEPVDLKTGGPQVRSAFLRQGEMTCHWPDDFSPEVTVDDPAVRGLAEALWRETRQVLEDRHERLNRQVFHTALERATSEVFAASDVGIKHLAAAKQALQNAWPEIETRCEYHPAPAEFQERPVLTARLDTTPVRALAQAPGTARLSLSVGDVDLAVEIHVPKQSWLYQAYERLTTGLDQMMLRARSSVPSRYGAPDERELTMGLRYRRQPHSVIEIGSFRHRR